MSKNNTNHAKRAQKEYREIIKPTGFKKAKTVRFETVIPYAEARERLKNALRENGQLRIED